MYDGDDAAPSRRPAPQSGSLTDWTTVKSGSSFDGDEDRLESTVAGGGSLKDHLEDQLSIAALLPDDRLICMALIDAVDEAGYLRADLLDIADRLGTRDRGCRGGAGRAAGLRSRRRGRPRSGRMPGAAAEGQGPARSGHGRRC